MDKIATDTQKQVTNKMKTNPEFKAALARDCCRIRAKETKLSHKQQERFMRDSIIQYSKPSAIAKYALQKFTNFVAKIFNK